MNFNLNSKNSCFDIIKPRKENICAVIVTYFPDDSFIARAISIAKLVGFLVIVDNTSCENNCLSFDEIRNFSNIVVIGNKSNLGIATALNQGVREAKNRKFCWVLLFDQDSNPTASIVDSFGRVYEDFPDKGRLAIIGSRFVDPDGYIDVEPSDGWEIKKFVITSGSLILMSIFDEVGMFLDELFIDHVDHEFCIRLYKKKYITALTCNPVMEHSIGRNDFHKFFYKDVRVSNHPAFRHYYMTRNLVFLFKIYFLVTPFLLMFLFCVRLKDIFFVVLYEDDKIEKIKAIVLGVYHGCRGTLGKLC